MKKKLIFITLTLWCGYCMAQQDFRKGYIITNTNDTIYGWIDYRGDIRNSKICSFKKTESEPHTDYAPADISAYRFIDSKYYVSKNIGTANEPHLLFLEYLLNGMASLYYYRDEETNPHYFIEKEETFVELKTVNKTVDVDNKEKIAQIKQYIGILKATLNVWEMNNKIDKAKLEHESLISIAKNYHQFTCTDGSECIVYEKHKPALAIRIGPEIGIQIPLLKYTDLYYPSQARYAFYKTDKLFQSLAFTGGININVWMPRMNEKLFLQAQMLYAKYHFSMSITGNNWMSRERPKEISFQSNALLMGIALKYEFPKGQWRPTLAAGGMFIYLPDATTTRITKYYQELPRGLERKLMPGLTITPGIHYYFQKKMILFVQLQYGYCKRRERVEFPPNTMHSIGLSSGIYF